MNIETLRLATSEGRAIETCQAGRCGSLFVLYGLHKRRVYFHCLLNTANSAESRGSDSRSLSAVVSQDWNVSWRVSFFHLAAPNAVNVVLMQLRKKSLSVVPLEETMKAKKRH